MDRLEHHLIRGARITAVLGAFFLLMVAGISVIDIVTRELTGRPIHGAHDIATLFTIVIVAACFPAGLLERRQIEVTLISGLVGKMLNRAMRVVAAFMTGFMFICIAWFLTLYAIKITQSEEYSMVLNWPLGPWWWVAAACFWACIPAQLFVIFAEAVGRPAYHVEEF